MSSTISSVGNSYPSAMAGAGGPRAMKRPDSSQMADEIFSQLDTGNQGYLQASDFGADNEDVFAALDSDSDGKVTKSELSTRLKELSAQLDDQFNAMRSQGMGGMMAGGMQGMPPPPPQHGGNDDGLDQSQLSAMASAASDAGDTQSADRFAALADNFDSADSNQDGKVSFAESIAYEQSQAGSDSSTAGSSGTDGSVAGNEQEARVMQRLMEMMRAYTQQDDPTNGNSLSLSV